MKSKMKKGYSLILMLIVTAFLLIIGAAVLTMHTSTRKLEVSYDNKSRIYYMAASGLNAGEAMWGSGKNQGTTEFNMPDSTGNPVITCIVNLKKDTPTTGENTVVSTATCKGISKSVSKVLGAAVAPTPTPTPSIVDGCINVYGGYLSIGNGNNTYTNANGSIYVQSDTVSSTGAGAYIGSNLNIKNGGLTIVNNAGNVRFDNNGTTSSVAGPVFIQSTGGVSIQQNLTTGTEASPSEFTILSNDKVIFDNNGTTNQIYGNAYINSNNGFLMNQTLKINKGDFTVENNTGDINFENNGNLVTVPDGSVLLKSASNTYLRKAFTTGKNFTADSAGGIDLDAWRNINVGGDLYFTCGDNGIVSTDSVNTGGACSFISKGDVSRTSSGSSQYNIKGDYYVKSDKDINNSLCINNIFGKSYTQIANNGTINYSGEGSTDTFSKYEQISGSHYLIDKNGLRSGSAASQPFTPSVPAATNLPENVSKITDTYSIGTVKDGQPDDIWDTTTYPNVACVKEEGCQPNLVVEAIKKDCGQKYKVIIIDGDFTVDWYQTQQLTGNGTKSSIDINNTIIYCTGIFKFENTNYNGTDMPVNLNHSVIYGKNVYFDQSQHVNMTAINKTRDAGDTFPSFTSSDITDVNSILDKYLQNYSKVS